MKTFFKAQLLLLLILPTKKVACQTSGPTQPEVTAVSSTAIQEMVNVFTGDFNYSIPLFELSGPEGDYPFVLTYSSSNVSMTQEASWVGFGWNLNVGSISRQVRGLPDDYNGVNVIQKYHRKPNQTYGFSSGVNLESTGMDFSIVPLPAGATIGGYYNNYNGFGFTIGNSVRFLNNTIGINYNNLEGPSLTNTQTLLKGSYKGASVNLAINSKRDFFSESKGFSGSLSYSFGSRQNESFSFSGITMSGGYNLSFNKPTYTPSIFFEEEGEGLDIAIKGGGEVYWNMIYGSVMGYYRQTKIKGQENDPIDISTEVFGLLFHHNGVTSDNSLLDFNRENEGSVRDETPKLPLPILTPDIYSVSSVGLNGTFSAKLNYIPIVFDPTRASETTSDSWGGDVASGQLVKVGISFNESKTTTESSGWPKPATEIANVNMTLEDAIGSEKAIFRFSDEITIPNLNDPQKPLFHELNSKAQGFDIKNDASLNTLKDKVRNTMNLGDINLSIDGRTPRKRNIQSFSNKELIHIEQLWPEFQVDYYNGVESGLEKYDRTNEAAVGIADAIGLFQITDEKGIRYIFGLPAYINEETEIVQSTRDISTSNATITYTSDYKSGDEYYSETIKPKYAYAHYLTCILGTDYIDADDIPGPSNGDLGFWIKFNYVKASGNYKLRAPFLGMTYSQGYLNTGVSPSDDRASVTFGEKEIWYLRSAETKTHFADFAISARNDAKGAANLEQDNDTPFGESMYKLDQIRVYPKKIDQNSRINYVSNTPIKSVRFNYDYSLVPDTPNSTSESKGKLTLKELSFSYQNNSRAQNHPYKFEYNESDLNNHNPSYEAGAIDSWGNYKSFNSYQEVIDFPFTKQDKPELDRASSYWLVKKIILPSQGSIDISYESDDYRFVQDKKAMKMYALKGVDYLDSSTIANPEQANSNIYVLMGRKSEIQNPNDYLTQMMEGVEELYFNIKINLKEGQEVMFERIKAYAKIGSFNLHEDNNNYYAEIEIRHPFDQVNYHPFAYFAWQHIQTKQPILTARALFDPNEDVSSNADKIVANLSDLLSSFGGAFEIMKGFVNHAIDSEWGREILLDSSWVRLNAVGRKLGGGARVKEIAYVDNWQNLSGEDSQTLGYRYSYVDSLGNSMGVAQSEPYQITDEDPFRLPTYYTVHNDQINDFHLFNDEPINGGYKPAPVVGYSKVIVKSIHADEILQSFDPSLGKTFSSSGIVEHEFYTSKEFPTKTDSYKSENIVENNSGFTVFIGSESKEKLHTSQGYSIELNNMHGKPKKTSYYGFSDDGRIINESVKSTSYTYSDKVDFVVNHSEPFNKSDSIIQDSLVHHIELIQKDYIVDSRSYLSKTDGWGINVNVDLSFAGVFPIPIPVPMPSESHAISDYKSVVTNKVITRSYLPISIVNIESGVVTDEQILALDAFTAEPILKTTINEFQDTVFNYTIPAHIHNKGMQPSFKNTGATIAPDVAYPAGREFISRSSLSGQSNLDTYDYLIKEGDEMLVSAIADDGNPIYSKTIVTNITEERMYFEPPPSIEKLPLATMKVIRSGARNMLTQKNGNILSLSHPILTRYDHDVTEPYFGYSVNEMQHSTSYFMRNDVYHGFQALPVLYHFAEKTNMFSKLVELRNINERLPFITDGIDHIIINDDQVRFIKEKEEQFAIKLKMRDSQTMGDLKEFIGYKIRQEREKDTSKVNLTVYFINSGDEIDSAQFDSPNESIEEVDYWEADLVPIERSIKYTTKKIDKVIDASIITFNDEWSHNYNQLQIRELDESSIDLVRQLESRSNYLNGEKGIWKPTETFIPSFTSRAYGNQRVDLRQDGLMNNFILFPLGQKDIPKTNWFLNQNIQSYSPNSYPNRVTDGIEVDNSSVYSFNNSMQVMYARNTTESSIAFESFEEYDRNQELTYNTIGTGNFEFQTIQESVYIPQEIIPIVIELCSWDMVFVRFPPEKLPWVPGRDPFPGNPLGTRELFNQFIFHNSKYLQSTELFDFNSNPLKLFDNSIHTKDGLIFYNENVHDEDKERLISDIRQERFTNNCDQAQVIGYRIKPSYWQTTRDVFISKQAHTGKRSLAVQNSVSYPQGKVDLKPGEKYLLSCWLSKNSQNLESLETTGINIYLRFDDTGPSYYGKPSSPVIDMWQKYEIEFTVPEEFNGYNVSFSNSNDFIDSPLFIDDIRMHPYEALVETYVYDPGNYKVVAILDNNNYATLYGYDEEGRLHLTQRETERGIYTISEYRSHTGENE